MLSEELKEILRERFTNNFDLANEDLNAIFANAYLKTVKKGDIFYSGNDCFGFILILKGVLRAFVSSNSKEITIFRLTKDESCVLCDTCSINSLENKVSVEIEQDSEIIVIPARIYKPLKEKYPSILNFTLKIVADRFARTINVMEQALFSPLSARIMNFLSQSIENLNENFIKITHEELANHLGSAREAVSRVLKELERSGQITQSRGEIRLVS